MTNAIIHGYECDGKSIVTIEAAIDEQKVSMTVSDNGAGIDNLEQAMEPMYTTKPYMERSGMGFTIMESFSDHLSVESIVGSGTIVKFEKLFSPVTETSRMR